MNITKKHKHEPLHDMLIKLATTCNSKFTVDL